MASVDTDAPEEMIDLMALPRAEQVRLLAQVRRDLADRYDVTDYLGRGAYATVWRARDRVTDETVAVKRLEAQGSGGDFYRELSALFKLRHPAVMRIVNLMDVPGGRYLILEHCPGGSLRSVIQQAPHGLPTYRVTALATAIAEGLTAAHAAGLIHRDLKPENVLFGGPPDQGQAKIADFGLAQVLRSGRMASRGLGTASGTPIYMAPEQFLGGAMPASDVYALGVICFELLHGHPPFVAAPAEMARRHFQETPVPRSDLSPGWVQLLARLLAKHPDDRPTAAALAEMVKLLPVDEPDAAPEQAVPADAFDVIAVPGGFAVATPTGLFGIETTWSHWSVPGLRCVTPAPDGGYWLGAGSSVWRWSGEEEPQRRFEVPAPVDALAATAQRLVAVAGGRLHEFDLLTSVPLWDRPLPAGPTPPIARLYEAGIVLAVASPPQFVRLRPTGQKAEELPLPRACELLLAGGRAMWGRGSDGRVVRLRFDLGRWEQPVGPPVTAMRVRSDGSLIAVGDEGELLLWPVGGGSARVVGERIDSVARAVAASGDRWAILTRPAVGPDRLMFVTVTE